MDTLGEEYSSTVGSYQPPANFQPAPHNYGLFLYEQSAPIEPTAAQIATLGLLNANASLSLRVKYSLGHMLQVPLEVKPGNSTLLEENSPWIITTGLHAHYHRLSMGDGVTFCVLAGSIETNWKSGEKEKIVSSLHPECTGSYSAGFSMAANVKVNGKVDVEMQTKM